MKSIAEIEEAVEKLPAAQLEELAGWLEVYRQKRASGIPIESWLQRARGAARGGTTTEDIMAITRGEG